MLACFACDTVAVLFPLCPQGDCFFPAGFIAAGSLIRLVNLSAPRTPPERGLAARVARRGTRRRRAGRLVQLRRDRNRSSRR